MVASVPIRTVTLESDAELAPGIINGLNSGVYELVGGVVRRVDNKQVVAWLRQVGDVAPATLQALPFNPSVLGTLIVSRSFLQLGVIVGGFAIIYLRLNAVRNELEEIKRTLAKLVLHPETGISLRRLTMLMHWRTPDLTGEEASENLSAAIWRVARESIKPEKFPPSLRDDPEKAPMKRLLDRDRDHRFLKRLGMAFEQIETLYGAVRCLEGYQIELEQMDRLGMSPDRILPASLSTDALVVCVPRDSELLSQKRWHPWS